MEMVALYKCLGDEQRVRMLNLLVEGPLCVCYLQELLGEEQVKMSKQLGYMKKFGLVAAHREGNWMIYSVREPISALLSANIDCLRASGLGETLRNDLTKRVALLERVRQQDCCAPLAVLQP